MQNAVFPTDYKMSISDLKIHDRGYLPHWEKKNGVYFITFRLADSLPKAMIDLYYETKEALERRLISENNINSSYEKERKAKLLSKFINNCLDSGSGECHLQNPQIADLVANTLKYFDGQRYKLYSWCVMPNHVHVLVKIFENYTLSSVMKSWKGFSAKEANKIIGRNGKFWQREYFDRLIRNEDEFYRYAQYILENPIKANLKDWKWVWIDDAIINGAQIS